MKKKIDYNSSVNQTIKSKLVEREVKVCFSYEMDAILRASESHSKLGDGIDLPHWEDILNGYNSACPKCGNTNIYIVPEKDKPSANDDCFECGSCGVLRENDDLNSVPKEIYEWWIVSEYLYHQLSKRHEAVLEWGNNYYWGRTTTGQAIMLDSVIDSICEEMEILDSQQYSWTPKEKAVQ